MTAALEGVSGQQHVPAALYPLERSGTHFTGGWVGPGPVWTGGKSRPHRDSIPDRPVRSSVAIPTELPGPIFWDVTQRILLVVIGVSVYPIAPILDCWTLDDETDRLSRNVYNNYQYTLRNIAEERRPHIHRGGSLKSRKAVFVNVCYNKWLKYYN